MSFQQKQSLSGNIHRLQSNQSTPPEEQLRAPTSAVNAIMGKLGLAREADEPDTGQAGLAKDLTDPAWMVRLEAVQKLGKMGRQAPLELLLVALRDSQSNVRIAATRALSRNPRREATVALLSALEDDEWMVRVEAARALGNLAESVPLEPLLHAAQDKDPAVRAATIWALGQRGNEQALETLDTALQDEDWSVREAAAFALGQLGKPDAIPSLLNARFDKDASVRSAVEQSLHQLYPEFSEAPPPPTDSFAQWLERTEHIIRVSPIPQNAPAGAQPVAHAVELPGRLLAAVSSPQKWFKLPGRINRPGRFGELSSGLLAAFLLICLLCSWFIIATWPRSVSAGPGHGVPAAFITYRGHNSSVSMLAWSPDDSFIASADTGGTLLIWQVASGEERIKFTQSGTILALQWENATTLCAVYGQPDKALQIYTFNINTGARSMSFERTYLPGVPQRAAWYTHANEDLLAFDTGNSDIQIWNMADWQHPFQISSIHNTDTFTEYTHLLWSDSGTQLATISLGGSLQVWSVATGKLVASLDSDQEQVNIATWVDYENEPPCLLFINSMGEVRKWIPSAPPPAKGVDPSSPPLITQADYTLENKAALTVAVFDISPDGRQLAMATSDGLVQMRDSTTMNLVDVYNGHSAQVNDIEWEPGGSYIATGSADTTVQIWQEPG
jgi:WD40 repeat protein